MEDLGRYTNNGLRRLLVKVVEEEKFELASLIRDELKVRPTSSDSSTLGMDEQIRILLTTTDFETIAEIIYLAPGGKYNPHYWKQNHSNPPTVEFLMDKAKYLLEMVWKDHGYETESYYEDVQYEGLTAFRTITNGVKTLGLKYTLPYNEILSDLAHLSEKDYMEVILDEGEELYMDFDDDVFFDDEDEDEFFEDDEDDIIGGVVFLFEGDLWDEKFDDEDDDEEGPISY